MPGYFEGLLLGLSNTFAWPGLLIPLFGTLLAMVVAFVPGVGGASIMALMLVLTSSWSPESVLLLFGALVGGATFMGSITAILFNIPGSAPNAASLLDGYPLNRLGYPRRAIACAATASALGSLLGVLLLLLLIPVLQPLLGALGPLERTLLGIWGLTTVIAVPGPSRARAGLMCLLGLLLALVGSDPVSTQARWTFGVDSAGEGLGIIPVLLGFFTLAEVLSWPGSAPKFVAPAPARPDDTIGSGVAAVLTHRWLALRASLIGTLVGIVPGIGGTVAGFVAYGHALQTSKQRAAFGHGDIRGLLAPEAANDAKDGGSLLPAIAFGLPGSEAGVFLVTVLLMHGLVPGTPMLSSQLGLTFTLIFALLVSNLLTSLLGVAAAPFLVGLRGIPLDRLALPVLVLSLVLLLQLNGRVFDVIVAVSFGLLGFFCKRHDWPRVPFVIAFVLGGFLERNLALSLRLMELDRIQFWQRPGAILIATMVLLSLLWMGRQGRVGTGSRTLDRSGLPGGLGILMLGLLFLVTALLGDYSGIAVGAAAATTLGAAALLIGSVPEPGKAGVATSPRRGMSADMGLPCLLLASFPFALLLLGFWPGMAGLVFGWALAGRRYSPGTLAYAGVWAGTSTLLAYLLLSWGNVAVPGPVWLAAR